MQAKHISDETAADDNGISASANPANNAALTIGGALHDGGVVTLTGGRIVEITSAGNDSGIDATVSGTDVNGDALSETIDCGNAGAVVTTAHFKTITGITAVGDPAGTVIAGTTTGAADVISKATCRLHSMDIVSGGTAGVVNFHNGITDGVPGDILFKHRTLGTDNTAPGHITFGGDGILFDQGMYVTYTVGHIDMMNFFFN
jgi:hypothetical protein